MIRTIALLPLLTLAAGPARADDAWVATRGLQPGEMLHAEDVEIRALPYPLAGGFSLDRSPAGLEVKHRVMQGRPLMDRDVGRHAVVRANAPVQVIWQSGSIQMQLVARALQDGAAGDDIRVLNTASARTLHGVVLPDGSVQVGGSQ